MLQIGKRVHDNHLCLPAQRLLKIKHFSDSSSNVFLVLCGVIAIMSIGILTLGGRQETLMAQRVTYCCSEGNLRDLVQASVNVRGGFRPVICQLTKTYVGNNENFKLENYKVKILTSFEQSL